MSPAEAARLFRRMERELPDVAAAAVTDGLGVLLESAIEQASGTETQADHRRNDHPIARRHGRVKPPHPPRVINVDGGGFRRDMDTEGPIESADQVAGAVVNFNEKEAWLLEGTETMLPRDLPGAVLERAGPEAERRAERRMAAFFDR